MNERKDLFIAMLIFVTASAPVLRKNTGCPSRALSRFIEWISSLVLGVSTTTKTIASIAHSSPEISVRQPHRVV
jgi:hypothetical protein